MANRSLTGYLNDASGNSLNALAGKTADFYSGWLPLKHDWIGLAVTNLNASGTSMTLDCTIECSPDGGTTVFTFNADNNSGTQAALTQITGDGATASAYEFWLQPFPELGGWTWRVLFNYGGTIGTNTVTARYFTRTTAEELR